MVRGVGELAVQVRPYGTVCQRRVTAAGYEVRAGRQALAQPLRHSVDAASMAEIAKLVDSILALLHVDHGLRFA